MEQLQYFFEEKIKKIPFIPRKLSIDENENILLKGVKFSGKTFLLKDYLSRQNRKFLYIDLDDIRVNIKELESNLQNFIDKNGIEIVAIDNYKKEFLVPKAKQVILSTCEPTKIDGFKTKKLYPLDFEEYIAFEKSTDIKIVFNNFLKNGTFPEISKLPDFKRKDRFFEIIKLFFSEEIEVELFKEISKKQGHKSSPYQIFTRLKDRLKISKDRFYSFFEELKEKDIIFVLEKFSYPKASKKIYLCDFALKNYLSFSKEFPKIFENALFLELIKKGYEVFYYDKIDFFIPSKKEVIFSIPFGSEVTIQKKITEAFRYIKELDTKKITVVSVTKSFKYYEENIEVEILPFYEWVLES